jgi:hypothetical protein
MQTTAMARISPDFSVTRWVIDSIAHTPPRAEDATFGVVDPASAGLK